MKRKLIAFLGILILFTMLIPTNAFAYGPLWKGLYVDTAHDGLRAIISTGRSPYASPPPFSFSALSPDSYQQEWYYSVTPDNSCVEAGTHFHRNPGGSTVQYFYVYDYCTTPQNFAFETNLSDSTFRGKYVRLNTWNDTGFSFQDENYDVRIIQLTSSSWGVYLYNYNTATYDWLYTGTGTHTTSGAYTFLDQGGTQQELGKYCPTLYAYGIIQMRGLQYRANGTWHTITSGDISYFNDAEYCFTNNTYKITTPNAYQWKMLPYGATY